MAGLMDMFGDSWDDPKSQAMMALAGGLMANDWRGGLMNYGKTMSGAGEAKMENDIKKAKLLKFTSDIDLDKLKHGREQSKFDSKNNIQAMILKAIEERRQRGGQGGGAVTPYMPVTGSGGQGGTQGGGQGNAQGGGGNGGDFFAGVDDAAILLDMQNNGGKNIGGWINDRTKPDMQVTNGYAHDRNRLRPGFMPSLTTSPEGSFMTQIGADGRPFISAPQGAIDTFSAYKLAAEQAKAGFRTETVTLPGGETVLATSAQLAAAAQGNPQQFGGQPQPQQPQPGGKPAPWRTGNPMIDAIAQTESNGNPNAVSPVGARGLMQVMPGTNTAPGFGVKPAGDGSESERTRVGQDYHGAMTERYKDPALAAIAYNWGPGNTDKWLSNGGDFKKLPAETQSYVAQVLTRNGVNGRGQAPQNTNPAPNQAPAQQSPTFGLKIQNQQEKDDKAAKSKAYETGLVEQAKADAEKRNPKMVWNESLGTFVTPTSREVMPALDATGKPVPYNKTEKNLTEGERKAATLLKRLEGSEKQLNAALVEKPSAAKPGIFASTLRSVGAEALANTMAVGSERQRVESAQLDILDAALTLGTGAAYTKEQLEGYRRSYFPQLGDSKENVKDKKDRLDNVIQAAKIAAGRAAPQATGAQNPAPKKDVPAQPMRGMVMDGFKFKGGDPSKQSNWEKQ